MKRTGIGIKSENFTDYFARLFIVILGLILIGIYYITGEGSKILFLHTIVVNLYLIWMVRGSKTAVIMFLFIFSYILYAAPLFLHGIDIAFHTSFATLEYYTLTLTHLLIFLLGILFFLKPIDTSFYIRDIFPFRKNTLLFLLCIVFTMSAAFLTKSGPTIIEAGIEGHTGNSVGGLALFEYALIFIILSFKYSGDNFFYKIILYIVLLLFMIKALLHGGRIEVVMTLMVVFILALDTPNLKYYHVIPLALVGVYFLLLVAKLRHNPLMILSDNVKDILLSPLHFDTINFQGREIASSHQGDVFHSSTRITGLIKEDFLGLKERIQAFINSFAIVFPKRFLPGVTSLGTFMKKEFSAGGGGFISTYWYGFLSIPGIIFISYYISWVLNRLRKPKSQFLILYAVMMLSTYPRWFAYDQITLFKLSFFIIPIYLLLTASYNSLFK